MNRLSDEELVSSYKKTEDAELVTFLLARYADVITGMSLNYLKNETDVEDFSQDLYIKLVQNLKNGEIRNFRSWFLTIIKNSLIDTTRKQQTRIMHMEILKSESSDLYELEKEDSFKIEEVFNSMIVLNEKEKKCIEELYLNEKSYKEAMDDNGWSFNEVRGFRDRAIVKIRKHISKTRKIVDQKISAER